MRLVTKSFSQDEWTEIISEFPDVSLMQTWEYGEAKARTGPWEVERTIFLEDNRLIGAAQAMVRPLPWLGGGLVWINRGPLWRREPDPVPGFFAARLVELRRYWVEERRMYLCLAPPVPIEKADSSQVKAPGYNWIPGTTGWSSAMVDLSDSVEQLRQGLSKNWRKQLNKAERLGVRCLAGRSAGLFENFLSNYKVQLSSKQIDTNLTTQLLQELQCLLPDERKMWVFEGRYGDEALGSLLVAGYGDTCILLALGLNEKGREVHGGYLMHWQALVKMKELGYRRLDLGGVDPRRTLPGILQFKLGLRGKPYQLISQLDACGSGWLSRAIKWYVRRRVRLLG
jgi:lipid II:glycine glycyltransferase (peptidoglycan interpeptide bridge formation enzyme)